MGFLQDKKILITSMISERSIAYGITKACRGQSTDLAFTYVANKPEEHVRKMAAELGSKLVFRCDVANNDEINQTFAGLGKHWSGLGDLVHSIGSTPKEALSGDFLDNISHEVFSTTHEISAYSLPALTRTAHPMIQGHNGSIVALTYLGVMRAIPNYNVTGMTEVSLEADIRFTTTYLDCEGIHCNSIPAGPIKTLTASNITDFGKLLGHVTQQNPLGRNVTIEEIGNATVSLLSDLSSGITGEITYVDGGYSINALSVEE